MGKTKDQENKVSEPTGVTQENTIVDVAQAYQLAQACKTAGISVDIMFKEITFRLEGNPGISELQKETERLKARFGPEYKGWKMWFQTAGRKILSTI